MTWQVVAAGGGIVAALVGIYLAVRYVQAQRRGRLAAEADAADARAASVESRVAGAREEALEAARDLTPEQMLGRLTERPR